MKTLIRLVMVVAVLIVVTGIGAFVYLDRIARSAIEQGGTWALGVETTLDSARVRPLAGTFSMSGLTVANPEGFDAEHFLALERGQVEVALGSLRENTVVLPVLTLSGLDANLQRTGGKANYQLILDNLKRFESQPPPAGTEPGKKFLIREVVIENVTVTVDLLPVGGSLTRVDVPVDEIRLEDVGSESGGGVALGELSAIIVKALFASILQAGAGVLPADLLQGIGSGLEGLGGLGEQGIKVLAGAAGQVTDITEQLGAGAIEGAGDVVRGAARGAGEVIEGAGKALEEAGKGIGNAAGGLGKLLGGDKKKKGGG